MYVVNPFLGLKLLHFLSLDFNRILQVPQNVFEEVHNLKSLHLEYNHINYLNESSFNGLKVCKTFQIQIHKYVVRTQPFKKLNWKRTILSMNELL